MTPAAWRCDHNVHHHAWLLRRLPARRPSTGLARLVGLVAAGGPGRRLAARRAPEDAGGAVDRVDDRRDERHRQSPAVAGR